MAVRRELVIVGGGPAGTSAALAARERGLDAVLVEGGRGSAGLHALRALGQFLVERPLSRAPASRRQEGLERLVRRAWERAAALADRRAGRLDRQGVSRVAGRAELPGPRGQVVVTHLDGRREQLEARAVILASGGRHAPLVGCDVEDGALSDPVEAIDRMRLPATAVVIGGGRAGVELASLLGAGGAQVTLVEAGPRLVPDADADVSAAVRRALEAHGVTVRVGVSARSVARADGGALVTLDGGQALAAEAVHATAGRVAEHDDWGAAEGTGSRLRTAADWVFRAGGAAGGSLSEERAWREGRAAVAAALGEPAVVPDRVVPVFVEGIAGSGWVGTSEEEAREQGHSLWIGRASLAGAGAVAPGFLKLVAARGSDRVLGVHVFGPQGREAVALGAVLVEAGVSRLDVRSWAFPPGTPAEALVEAASQPEAR